MGGDSGVPRLGVCLGLTQTGGVHRSGRGGQSLSLHCPRDEMAHGRGRFGVCLPAPAALLLAAGSRLISHLSDGFSAQRTIHPPAGMFISS